MQIWWDCGQYRVSPLCYRWSKEKFDLFISLHNLGSVRAPMVSRTSERRDFFFCVSFRLVTLWSPSWYWQISEVPWLLWSFRVLIFHVHMCQEERILSRASFVCVSGWSSCIVEAILGLALWKNIWLNIRCSFWFLVSRGSSVSNFESGTF